MGFRNGPLENFPIGKEGSGKPLKILSISFASFWRHALHRGLNPLAIGTEDDIQIWHAETSSSWRCYFIQNCDGGAKHLTWSLDELSLVYAEKEVMHLVRFDKEKEDYTSSVLFQGDSGSSVRSVSCNHLAWAVAYSSEKLTDEYSKCTIIKKMSRTRNDVTNVKVEGSIARLIPGLPFLLVGDPTMNSIQVYSNSSSWGAAPTREWNLLEKLDIKGNACEIVVFIKEAENNKIIVAILGSGFDVHLYELSHFFRYPESSLEEAIGGNRVQLIYLQSVSSKLIGPIPRSIAFEPYVKKSIIAVSYSDGSICIFQYDREKYRQIHTLSWEKHWKDDIKKSHCLAWPQPGSSFPFAHPVLATAADHGFVVFYEIVDHTDPYLLPDSGRDIRMETNYYYQKCDASEAVSEEIEKTPLHQLKEAFAGIHNRIFCNLSVNLADIKAIGFEIDLISQYKPELVRAVCWDALKSLAAGKRYPKQLTHTTFKFNPMLRGLVIDIKRGNFIKMDKGRQVHISFHGTNRMSDDQIHEVYGTIPVGERFDGTKFVCLDTFFSLCEGQLFAELVDYIDENPGTIPPERRTEKDYERTYRDIRSVFDMLHRDGSIKQEIFRLPEQYMTKNTEVVTMLQACRKRGLKTFLISNSLWRDTDIIMSYSCQAFSYRGRRHSWLGLFDAVITSRGGLKQNFFDCYKEQDIFEVDRFGSLQNILDVTIPADPEDFFAQKVYQGGDIGHLLTRLQVNSAAEVLYLSLEMIGGVQYNMKAPCWRTLLVIPELKGELETNRQSKSTRKELIVSRKKSDELENQIQFLQRVMESSDHQDPASVECLTKLLDEQLIVEQKRKTLQAFVSQSTEAFDQAWGPILKAGNRNSRFAQEVVQHACLYTDKVTNLANYDLKKCFDFSVDFMSHEQDLFDEE